MTNDERHAIRSVRYVILVLVIALVVLWIAPDVAARLNRTPDEAWARVQKTSVIRFAMDASYPPFDGLGSQEDFFGLDVDIAEEIARRMGVRVEFINVSYDSLYDVLEVGQADATISALIVDPSRTDKWKYSISYFDAGQVLIRPAGFLRSTPQRSGLGETRQVSSVAVEYGSEGDGAARRMARRASGINIVYSQSIEDALRAVIDGQANAAIVDGVGAAQLLPKFAGLQRVEQVTHDPYALAVWGESTQLLDAINAALDAMQRDGAIDRIANRSMSR